MDRWPLAILAVVPILFFAIPTIIGHPPIAQDNLIQNFPLRVLSGQILATGHLPTWNQYIFSGSPLLGALNAGSLYPLTGLFAFLPPLVAWFLNLAACYWAAAFGTYALARWLRASPRGALLGAISYTYLGAMIGQMVHLGVIQGQAWLPWVVLACLIAIDRLRGTESDVGVVASIIDARWPLLALVALVGLEFLTGEPRAIADLEIVLLIMVPYAVVVAGRSGLLRRFITAGVLLAASAWGVALSACQLLPGSAFIADSQRASLGYEFFGSGSLSLQRSVLLLIPDLNGGTGLFHQPRFFVNYNLAEVTGYVGLLGLVALCAALGVLISRARVHVPRGLALFVVMAFVGLICAWGSFTPIGHALWHIPLLGKTRLQSRSIVVFDLACSVLVAWLVTRVSEDKPLEMLAGWRRWLAITPLGVTTLLGISTLIWPTQIEMALGAKASAATQGRYLAVWIAASVVIAVMMTVVLFRASGSSRTSRLRWITGLVAADTALFLLSSTVGIVPGKVPVEPSRSEALAVLGNEGRTALIDPPLQHYQQFIPLGQPDTNVLTKIPSVQGYGSLIDSAYGEATGTHAQAAVDPCQLRLGRFDQLRLTTMVVAASQLTPLLSVAPSSTGATVGPAPITPCPGAPRVANGPQRTFYFGQILDVRRISLMARSTAVLSDRPLAESLRVAFVASDGSNFDAPAAVTPTSTGWSIDLGSGVKAAGFTVIGPADKVMDTSTLTVTDGSLYWLAGAYQSAMDSRQWRMVRTMGDLQIFKRTGALRPPTWVQHGDRGSRVLSTRTAINGNETDIITMTSPGVVYRSVSDLPGWKATAESLDGRGTRSLRISSADLIEKVTLPSGRWRLSFHYEAPQMVLGLGISVASGAGLLLAVLLGLRWRRGRRGNAADRVRP
ncbi:MAG: hypothetical protein WCI12_08560 [Actinomycetes bacterium]